jgi:hypothetical protein
LQGFYGDVLPVFVIDYHSYGELVLWPYAYDYVSTAPDDMTLGAIGAEIAARTPRWGGGYYTPEQASQMYAMSGSSLDWEYGELNAFAYLIETCTSFYPGEAELNHAIAGNVQGALYLQERVDGPGVRGTITEDGLPVQGTISVLGVDDPPMNTPRRSNETLGDYYRILSPGTYDIRYDLAGWDPVLVEDVVVPADTYVILNVNFGTSSIAETGATDWTEFAVFPCPITQGGSIGFRLPPSHDPLSLMLYDAQGRLVADFTRDIRAARRTRRWETDDDAWLDLPAGVYLAKLRAGSAEAVRRLVVMSR